MMKNIKQLIINGKKSFDDFGVYIGSRKISQPTKKSIKESVPFSNKVYDFSKLNGELYWEERKLEYSFDIAEYTTEEMEVIKTKLLTWLLNVHDSDIYDPYIGDYHFHGSYDSDSWSEDFGAGTINVTFSVYPYKISNSDFTVIESMDGETTINGGDEIENTSYSQMRRLSVHGASYQKTTKGNQLFNYKDGRSVTNGITVDENDWITVMYDNSSGEGVAFCYYYTSDLNLKPNTKYTVVTEIKEISGTGKLYSYSKLWDTPQSDGQFSTEKIYNFTDLTNNQIKVDTPTTLDTFENLDKNHGIRTMVRFGIGESGSITFRLSVLEDTSVTPETFIYEPYTNGASPNYSYPQKIKTLAGIRNFYNFEDVESKNVEVSADENGWITCQYDNSSGTNVKYFNYWTNNLNLKTDTEYNIICEVKKVSGTGKLVFVSTMTGSGQFNSVHGFGFETLWNNCIKTKLVTTKTDFTDIKSGLRTFIQFDAGQKGSVTFRLSVIENTSITSDNFTYVPFEKWLKIDTSTPNLYNFKDLKEKSNEVVIDNDGWITCKYDNSLGSNTKYLNYYTHNLNLKPSTNYIVVVEVKEVSGTGRLFSYSYHGDVGGQFNRSYAINLNTLSKGMIKICEATTKDSFNGVDYGLRTYACFDSGESGSITFRLSVLEDTSVTADTFKYCGYGKDSILIDMIDNELVQIGDVKDELIIDDSSTKIVKNIGKFVFDGSEDWGTWTLTNGNTRFNVDVPNGKKEKYLPICSHFKYEFSNEYGYMFIGDKGEVCLQYNGTLEEFKTWLSENPMTVYYLLAEPYEIELTKVELLHTFDEVTQITINDELNTTLDVSYNEKKTILINNNSSHRITPTIKSEGNFTIKLNNLSYSVAEGVYTNSEFYLESGLNEVVIVGVGKIAFEYVEEVF